MPTRDDETENQPPRYTGQPWIQNIEPKDDVIKIVYRNNSNRARRAIFRNNEAVDTVLARWRSTGILSREDRFILADHTVKGFTAPLPEPEGRPESKRKERKAMDPEEAARRSDKYGKAARLRADARQLAEYKDWPLVYVGLVVLVSLVTFALISI